MKLILFGVQFVDCLSQYPYHGAYSNLPLERDEGCDADSWYEGTPVHWWKSGL